MRASFDETRNGIVDAKVESLEETNARSEVQARKAAPTRAALAQLASDVADANTKLSASYGNMFKNRKAIAEGKQRKREKEAGMA
eukprot:2436766-Pleurochrysis_carterae.AAC.1